MSGLFASLIAAIDGANAGDPNFVSIDGAKEPAEFVYSKRMSAMLDRFAPDASELLKIAVRAQHIERWTSPRSAYPDGRIGYLRWRTDLKNFHAERTGQFMSANGYDEAKTHRVKSLIRKDNLKYDAEVQTLEDVVCLVFLEDYLAEFVKKHDEVKVIDILRKTWGKMSPKAQTAALELKLPKDMSELISRALRPQTEQ
jgi:uncharacterized protein DUF4202